MIASFEVDRLVVKEVVDVNNISRVSEVDTRSHRKLCVWEADAA